MSLKVIQNGTIRKLVCGVLFAIHIVTIALSCISSEIKPDIGQNRDFFHIPLAFDAPVRGVPVKYCHPLWYGKN